MSKIEQLNQLCRLRMAKVDQLLAQTGRLRVASAKARSEYQTAIRHRELTESRTLPNFDALFEKTAHMADPQTRLSAVNQKILRQRADTAQARRLEMQAKSMARDKKHQLDRMIGKLSMADAQLVGMQTLLAEEVQGTRIVEEGQADEDALDQFSARRAAT